MDGQVTGGYEFSSRDMGDGAICFLLCEKGMDSCFSPKAGKEARCAATPFLYPEHRVLYIPNWLLYYSDVLGMEQPISDLDQWAIEGRCTKTTLRSYS